MQTHPLGKGEVRGSTPRGSTTFSLIKTAAYRNSGERHKEQKGSAEWAKIGAIRAKSVQCAQPFRVGSMLLAAALAFDPHVLLLSWSAERQETVAATSRATCEAAQAAIAAGRWLADDPPAAMRCERGSAFAPGEDCIQGYSCPRRPQ